MKEVLTTYAGQPTVLEPRFWRQLVPHTRREFGREVYSPMLAVSTFAQLMRFEQLLARAMYATAPRAFPRNRRLGAQTACARDLVVNAPARGLLDDGQLRHILEFLRMRRLL